MAGNTFGHVFRLTTFGESHGQGLGGIVDGCPAGLEIDEAYIQKELDLRKPGQGLSTSPRKEADIIHILSGIFEGKTTGTPIAFFIANENQRSSDYGNLADVFRPGHADWTYFKKYNGIRDYRGGGRSSGRETTSRVAGGAIAKKLLSKYGINIYSACVELGGIAIDKNNLDMENAIKRSFFAGNDEIISLWEKRVEEVKKNNDTLGGIVRIEIKNVPAGLGEPVFDKLSATLAHALMSVGAIKGIEIGEGFAAAKLTGSQNNDILLSKGKDNNALFESNHAGGILGGISSGQDIILKAAVKPIASISREQQTIDKNGNSAKILIGGRHDISAIPRVVPVLSAMAALALADALLLQLRMGNI